MTKGEGGSYNSFMIACQPKGKCEAMNDDVKRVEWGQEINANPTVLL